MPWSRKFDDPIPLPDGRTIHTLKQAGIYIVGLPKKEAALPHWQRAMETLIAAAEGRDFIMQARIGMLRALNHGKPPPERERKRAKKFNIIGERK